MDNNNLGEQSEVLPKQKRLVSLDVLRGIALLGILLVNYSFFAMPDGSFGSYINLAFPAWHDQTAIFLIKMFCDGKFILIFRHRENNNVPANPLFLKKASVSEGE